MDADGFAATPISLAPQVPTHGKSHALVYWSRMAGAVGLTHGKHPM